MDNLDLVVEELMQGNSVIFPTETSYGLGCDATNQEAVNKIYEIKGRDFNKPLLVVVSDVEMAKKYLAWNDVLDELAKKYWINHAAPLTIVGQALASELAQGVITKENTLAVRVTHHSWLKKIVAEFGGPVVATSANISGEGELYSVADVIKTFENRSAKPDVVVDGGDLLRVKPSTLVSVESGNLKVLRQGDLFL